MMKHYAEVDEHGAVLQVLSDEQPPAGPHSYYEIPELINWSGPKGHVLKWLDGTHKWVETRSLEEAKADVWDEVKQKREQVICEDLETPYGVLQCRPKDRQNITDAILLAQALTAMDAPVQIDWTMADNTVVTLSAEQLTNIGLILGQKVQAAHARARELRAAIEECTSVAEVNALSWDQ